MAISLFSPGKLRASALNLLVTAINAIQTIIDAKDTCYQTGAITASSSVGTSATAVLTISNVVFKAGRAYRVEAIGGYLGSTTLECDVSLWKNGTGGTQVGALYRTPCAAGGAVRNGYGATILRNTATSDVTFTSFALALASSTGTVTHEAATNRPRQFIVTDCGLASAYSNAFVVT